MNSATWRVASLAFLSMLGSDVFLQSRFFRELTETEKTGMFDALMDRLNVSLKINFLGRFVITLITQIFHSIMYSFNMLQNIIV